MSSATTYLPQTRTCNFRKIVGLLPVDINMPNARPDSELYKPLNRLYLLGGQLNDLILGVMSKKPALNIEDFFFDEPLSTKKLGCILKR